MKQRISTSAIQAIKIYNDADAVEKYGSNAKNGVNLFTVKQETFDDMVRSGLLKQVL